MVVCGGSGVGKSEIASVLSYYLNRLGLGSYTLSATTTLTGFRNTTMPRGSAFSGRAESTDSSRRGQYTKERFATVKELQASDSDSNPEQVKTHRGLPITRVAAGTG